MNTEIQMTAESNELLSVVAPTIMTEPTITVESAITVAATTVTPLINKYKKSSIDLFKEISNYDTATGKSNIVNTNHFIDKYILQKLYQNGLAFCSLRLVANW